MSANTSKGDALLSFPIVRTSTLPRPPFPTDRDIAKRDHSELGAGRGGAPRCRSRPRRAERIDEVRRWRPAKTCFRERYLLETQIGNGGTATVWRAVDLRRDAAVAEGRRVAIKLLRPELRFRPTSIARLQREFRQTQAVVHPNVVRFFDIDCDRGAWFIVMEHLTGETLGAALHRAAPASLAQLEAIRIGSAIGDALAHAHECGVTMATVKPANVFMAASGELSLFDFGVARSPPGRPTQ